MLNLTKNQQSLLNKIKANYNMHLSLRESGMKVMRDFKVLWAAKLIKVEDTYKAHLLPKYSQELANNEWQKESYLTYVVVAL